MDLRNRLQVETWPLHEQIEQAYLLKKIVLQQVTLNEYRLLIKKFYSFIAPCEAQINSLPCKTVLINREKIRMLEQDLQSLGVLGSTIPQCDRLPVLVELEDVLGYLYVMEGATLGGQIITRLLQNHLQIKTDLSGNYFYGYGNKTKAMWVNFCHYLNKISNLMQQDKIILSARLTYTTLYQWIEDPSLI